MKQAKRDMKKPRQKYCTVIVDREGGIPLPDGCKAKVGDEFACWQEGEKIIVAFPRLYRGNRKIPDHAFRGEVQPGIKDAKKPTPRPTRRAR